MNSGTKTPFNRTPDGSSSTMSGTETVLAMFTITIVGMICTADEQYPYRTEVLKSSRWSNPRVYFCGSGAEFQALSIAQ
jgi:hypothetical protein